MNNKSFCERAMIARAFLLSMIMFFFSTINPSIASDVTRSHDFVDGEVLTAAQLDTAFDEIVTELNDIDGDQLASNIVITTSGAVTITGTTTLSTVDINGGAIDGTTVGSSTQAAGKFTTILATDKVSITQTDNNEYIDSLVDGELDFGATTSINAVIGGTEQIQVFDGSLKPTTDNDIDLGGSSNEFKDLYIDGTANIDSLVADTADINAGTLDGVNIGTTTATGELIVNDASDDADGLGSQGTSGQYLQSAGAGSNPTWATVNTTTTVLYTSDDTFTVPAGVTKVYLTMVGGGGGGSGGAGQNGGGAGGNAIVQYPFTVTPSAELTVDVGAGGAAGANGSTTSFDSIDVGGGEAGATGDGGDAGATLAGGLYAGGTPSIGGGAGSDGDGSGGGGGGASIFGAGGAGNNSAGAGTAGAANSGSGGGGGDNNQSGGAGGSGFVLVQY